MGDGSMGRKKKWTGYRITSFLIPVHKESVIERARDRAREMGISLGELIILALELYLGVEVYSAVEDLELEAEFETH